MKQQIFLEALLLKYYGFVVLIALITPYIRMLDSDWLIAVIFFTNTNTILQIP
jgi:hypothetical protein